MVQSFENVLAFEAMKLSDEQIIAMFQQLVDSGDIWRLPDDYLITAANLIDRGILSGKKRVN